MAAYSGHVPCVQILLKWLGIENDPSAPDTERDRILENVTLSAMTGCRNDVLQILPRLHERNIDNIIGRLGDPNLLFTIIRWNEVSIEDRRLPLEPVAIFFLNTYTFDWSVRDETGANALSAAAKQDMAELVRLILENNEDSLNRQDHSGRTPVSWAAEKSHGTLSVLLGHRGTRLELEDSEGFAPIDYFLENFGRRTASVLPLMIPLLERGINTIDRHGCTLLHDLIEVTDARKNELIPQYSQHWDVLTSYQGRNIFESRYEPDEEGDKLLIHYNISGYSRPPRLGVSDFRQALGAVSVSAAEIRSSPCQCGIGTMFLAVSTENVGLVEVLLDFYPDLVNDKFSDGSSLLDLASCIADPERRQFMSDLILSRNPNIRTCGPDKSGFIASKSVLGDE